MKAIRSNIAALISDEKTRTALVDLIEGWTNRENGPAGMAINAAFCMVGKPADEAAFRADLRKLLPKATLSVVNNPQNAWNGSFECETTAAGIKARTVAAKAPEKKPETKKTKKKGKTPDPTPAPENNAETPDMDDAQQSDDAAIAALLAGQ